MHPIERRLRYWLSAALLLGSFLLGFKLAFTFIATVPADVFLTGEGYGIEEMFLYPLYVAFAILGPQALGLFCAYALLSPLDDGPFSESE